MISVAIVYHSGFGHTKAQAEAVERGARSVPGVAVDLITAEAAEGRHSDLAISDAIVFGAPTYMGSASSTMKHFMESTSKIWAAQGWRDKIAAAFTNSASQSGDKLNTLVELSIFAAQHGMVWVGLDLLPGNNSSKGSTDDLNRLGGFLGAMAQSNADQGPEHGPSASDLKTAEHLGRRVALAAAAWRRGRQEVARYEVGQQDVGPLEVAAAA